jgi:hypothetical protein
MLITNKAMTLNGKPYGAGQRVDPSELAAGKAEQLVAQRFLRDTEASAPASCRMLRNVRINGKDYKKGTKVNTSRLMPGKLAQMLDHRILEPAAATS